MNSTFQPNGLQADFEYWAKMPTWTESEAAALLCGLNPWVAERGWGLSNKQEAEYEGLLELAQRAINCGRVGCPPTPKQWLAWAKKFNIFIPPELKKQVERFWPEEQSTVSARICDETACENQLIAMMKSAPDNPRPKAEVRQAQFSDLPKRAFNRAWANAVRAANAPKWSAPGARKNQRT